MWGDGAPGGAEPDFSVLGIDSVDMTSDTGYLGRLIRCHSPSTAAWDGMLFQIGMNNTATNYEGVGHLLRQPEPVLGCCCRLCR